MTREVEKFMTNPKHIAIPSKMRDLKMLLLFYLNHHLPCPVNSLIDLCTTHQELLLLICVGITVFVSVQKCLTQNRKHKTMTIRYVRLTLLSKGSAWMMQLISSPLSSLTKTVHKPEFPTAHQTSLNKSFLDASYSLFLLLASHSKDAHYFG